MFWFPVIYVFRGTAGPTSSHWSMNSMFIFLKSALNETFWSLKHKQIFPLKSCKLRLPFSSPSLSVMKEVICLHFSLFSSVQMGNLSSLSLKGSFHSVCWSTIAVCGRICNAFTSPGRILIENGDGGALFSLTSDSSWNAVSHSATNYWDKSETMLSPCNSCLICRELLLLTFFMGQHQDIGKSQSIFTFTSVTKKRSESNNKNTQSFFPSGSIYSIHLIKKK